MALAGFFNPIYSDSLLNSITNCNRYYRHRPGTQSVHISKDIMTPYSTVHFDQPLLLYTIPVEHLAHTKIRTQQRQQASGHIPKS